MILRAKYGGTVLTIAGIVGAVIVGLALTSYYLMTQLSNTKADLRDSNAQIVFLQEQKEIVDLALKRLGTERNVIRDELIRAREIARKDQEYQEWSPAPLPQIIVDELSRPQ